jgi:hypothetical protein
VKPDLRGPCLLGTLVLTASLAAAKPLELSSAWPKTAVKVDGVADEWAGLMRPLADTRLLIGVQNDGDYLFLCVKTSDPLVKRQLTMLGITVSATLAGTKKTFGVRYPAGMEASRAPAEREWPPPTAGEVPTGARLDQVGAEFELIGPSRDDRLRVPRSEAHPVQAAIGDDSGVLVIEIRLPLGPSAAHPLALGGEPGKPLVLELETELSKRDLGSPAQVNPGGFGGGGRAGHGGVVPSEMEPGMGARRGVPDPIKVRIKILLAARP